LARHTQPTQRSDSKPLTLAEAVTAVVYRRELTSSALAERRRRHGGRWPRYLRKKLDQVGDVIVDMIRTRKVPAYGFAGERDDGTGRAVRRGDMVPIVNDEAFLAHRLWADPCTDTIWTEPQLPDGSFNPIDRGYLNVQLDRAQFLKALGKQHTAIEAAPGAAQPGNDLRYRTGAAGRPGSMHLIWHEYERRRDAGLVKASLAEEARCLAEWLKRAHPQAAPNQPRSIENRIRRL
jgi:hypothetical protein